MFRYGLGRFTVLVAICTGILAAAMLVFGQNSPDLPVLVSFVIFTVGVIVFDTSRTGRRVLTDFRKGAYDLAARGTRWLMRYSLRRTTRATLQLNLAACHLAAGDYELGGETLREIERPSLGDKVAGIWENNYAYYLLCTGGDPAESLRLSDQAAAINPKNPAFRSTRGIALLALGRLEDAIAELQRSVEAGLEFQGPAAMAENYHHLAQAWDRLGEVAYARDHYLKSVNMGPGTPFGVKSAEKLQQMRHLWPERG